MSGPYHPHPHAYPSRREREPRRQILPHTTYGPTIYSPAPGTPVGPVLGHFPSPSGAKAASSSSCSCPTAAPVLAGPGIAVQKACCNGCQYDVISNTGVLDVTAGPGIAVSGTPGHPIISATGGGGGGQVNSISTETPDYLEVIDTDPVNPVINYVGPPPGGQVDSLTTDTPTLIEIDLSNPTIPAVNYIGPIGGGQVNTVTSSDPNLLVDNGDPANPVLSLAGPLGVVDTISTDTPAYLAVDDTTDPRNPVISYIGPTPVASQPESFTLALSQDVTGIFLNDPYQVVAPLTDTSSLGGGAYPSSLYTNLTVGTVDLATATWTVGVTGSYLITMPYLTTTVGELGSGLLINGTSYYYPISSGSITTGVPVQVPFTSGDTVQLIGSTLSGTGASDLVYLVPTAPSTTGLQNGYGTVWSVVLQEAWTGLPKIGSPPSSRAASSQPPLFPPITSSSRGGGRLTARGQPKQTLVGFYAVLVKDITITTADTPTCQIGGWVSTPVGVETTFLWTSTPSPFDPVSGSFTAPSTGLYRFDVGLQLTRNQGLARLLRNGRPVRMIPPNYGISSTIRLEAGDILMVAAPSSLPGTVAIKGGEAGCPVSWFSVVSC